MSNQAFIGPNPAQSFDELFLLAAVIRHGHASPGVLEAITHVQRLGATLVVNDEANARPLVNQALASASPVSVMPYNSPEALALTVMAENPHSRLPTFQSPVPEVEIPLVQALT